ncbi:MAG: SDR family NAD(P)-dependent oxidoreductase, partial [Deltaproteobacteria bacterium]|nr:SDR family NAD(P)-dependent oxidoreductase [Deltaproteobacteria bacterium]
MDKKNIFVVGGSSGIGLEIVKKLRIDQNEIYVASRTSEFLSDYPDIHHLSTDITEEIPELDGLPDVVHGLVYCPGTIVLKPFQRLTMADFRNDLEINLLGAVKIIQSCLKRLKKSPT